MKEIHSIKEYKRIKETLTKGIVLVGSLSLLTGTPVVAQEVHTTSTAIESNQELSILKGINLYVDDRSFTPTDVNGNEVYPFVYNGTTYLPIRAIANLFGCSIEWHQKEQTVYLITNSKDMVNNTPFRNNTKMYSEKQIVSRNVKLNIDGKPFIPLNANNEPVDIFAINGTTYLPVRALATAFNIPIEWDGTLNTVFLGKHRTQINPNNYTRDISKEAQTTWNYSELLIYQIEYDCEHIEANFDQLNQIYIDRVESYCIDHDTLDPLRNELMELTEDITLEEMNLRKCLGLITNYDLPIVVSPLEKSESQIENIENLTSLNVALSNSLNIIERSSDLRIESDQLVKKYQEQIIQTFAKYNKTLKLIYPQ